MRRIHLVTVVALLLITLIFAYSQSPQPSPQSVQTATRTAASQPVKAKKVLVRALPKGLEGIVLKDGVFTLSPGFKFTPRTENSIALVRNESPGGGSATVDCSCSGNVGTTGACVPKTVSGGGTTYVSCGSAKENKCTGECIMVVTMGGSKTRLAIF